MNNILMVVELFNSYLLQNNLISYSMTTLEIFNLFNYLSKNIKSSIDLKLTNTLKLTLQTFFKKSYLEIYKSSINVPTSNLIINNNIEQESLSNPSQKNFVIKSQNNYFHKIKNHFNDPLNIKSIVRLFQIIIIILGGNTITVMPLMILESYCLLKNLNSENYKMLFENSTLYVLPENDVQYEFIQINNN